MQQNGLESKTAVANQCLRLCEYGKIYIFCKFWHRTYMVTMFQYSYVVDKSCWKKKLIKNSETDTKPYAHENNNFMRFRSCSVLKNLNRLGAPRKVWLFFKRFWVCVFLVIQLENYYRFKVTFLYMLFTVSRHACSQPTKNCNKLMRPFPHIKKLIRGSAVQVY